MFTFKDGDIIPGIKVKGKPPEQFVQIGGSGSAVSRFHFSRANPPQVREDNVFAAEFNRLNRLNQIFQAPRLDREPACVLLHLDLSSRTEPGDSRSGKWFPHSNQQIETVEIAKGHNEVHLRGVGKIRQPEYLLAMFNGSKIIVRPLGVSHEERNAQFVISCARIARGALTLVVTTLARDASKLIGDPRRARIPVSSK